MTTYVLVPGAWLGGWCWKRVATALRAAGHDVYTPTLTGLGERVHLGTPETNLDTHVQDVINLLQYEDLMDVTLVGHSYAGMVVTGVADRAPERIGRLVYVAAAVPQDGDSLLGPEGSQYRSYVRAEVDAGDGWRWQLPSFEVAEQFGGPHRLSVEDQTWLRSKAAGQPFEALSQPLRLQAKTPPQLPRVYIRCMDDVEPPPQTTRAEGWTHHELDTGHWPMFSAPEALTTLLLQCAR